ncbi:MAG: 3-dehydroquinate synthase family protein [Acidobacteriota bacterium]|nr:3-dehydroquinate synthase family protein [Acidobacteriota bacterium]
MKRDFSFVAAGARTDVFVGEGAYAGLDKRLAAIAQGRWFLITSKKIFKLHGQLLLAGGAGRVLSKNPLFVPDGEAAKTWDVLGELLQELMRRGLRRDGGVVAFGGGTVGDVAGLAAALALRGVPVVQAPTTLLAACDSALGGKTAVDLPSGKNLVGAFHAPRLVVVDTAMLETLPLRAFRSGLAEVVKTSFLDAAFHRAMARLEVPLAAREPTAVAEAVRRSLAVKARAVGRDPFERTGERAALNLGHTVGHALETASGHRLQHGEAVAWGLLAALRLSVARAGLAPRTADALMQRVMRLVSPPVPSPAAVRGMPGLLMADKKADRAGLNAVLLAGPGRPMLVRVETAELARAFDEALGRYNRVGWVSPGFRA